MFAILLVFIILVIGVIWVCQVGLLEVFYRNTKFSELENAADKIESTIMSSGDVESVVYNCTEDCFSSIVVFEIRSGKAYAAIEAIRPGNSIMPFFSKKDMQDLYDRAMERGGDYIATARHSMGDPRGGIAVEFSEYRQAYFSFSDYHASSAHHVLVT